MFTSARINAPCIIFFDEIDQPTSKRSGSEENKSVGNLKTIFFAELDRLAKRDASSILLFVIGATNLP